MQQKDYGKYVIASQSLVRLAEARKTTKHITVAIVLPCYINAGDFTVRIIEAGDVLEITVEWARPLMDISFLPDKWIFLYMIKVLPIFMESSRELRLK